MFTPFKIIGLAISGKFSRNPQLKKDFQIYLVLQFLNIFLACVSAYLGLARARVIFSGTSNPEMIAWLFAGTWAAIAFLLLAHITDRMAFRSYGGEFGEGEGKGFIVTLFVFLIFGGLDLYMNLEGVKPASYELTRNAYTANTSPIDARYQAQIQEHEEAIAKIEEPYYWKGKLYFEPYPVTRHPKARHAEDKARRDEHLAAIERIRTLRDQEKTAEINMANQDLSRYNEEISMKTNGFTWLTYLMYILMAAAGYRASLYSQLVLDYFEENPYGDIPGTQEERFGARRKGVHIKGKKTKLKEAIDELVGKADEEELPDVIAAVLELSEQTRESDPVTADLLEKLLEDRIKNRATAGKKEPIGYPRRQPVQEPENTGNSGKNRPNHTEITGKVVPPPSGNSKTVVERFYRTPPPDNTGKSYDLSKAEQRKVQQVKAVYKEYLADHGTPPTQATLAQELGWSEKTARKYFHLSGLRKQEQDE